MYLFIYLSTQNLQALSLVFHFYLLCPKGPFNYLFIYQTFYLYIYLCIFLSIDLSTYVYIFLSISQSFLSIFLCIYLSIYLESISSKSGTPFLFASPKDPFDYLFMYQTIFLSTYVSSIYLTMYLSIYLPIYPSIYLESMSSKSGTPFLFALSQRSMSLDSSKSFVATTNLPT